MCHRVYLLLISGQKECFVAVTNLLEKTTVYGNNLNIYSMKKILFVLLVAICGFAACQNIDLNISEMSNDVLSVQIEQYDTTKTVLDNNNILWSEYDQIIAFMKSSYGFKYQIKPTFVGKTYADFSKVQSSDGDDLSAGMEFSHNVAYYPYSETIKCLKSDNNYTLEVQLPSEQTYVSGSFGNEIYPMVAVSEDNNITFKNICGGIKLRLKGTQKVTSIKIQGKNDETLSGSATVTVYTDDNKPSIIMTDETSDHVILNCGTNGVQLSGITVTDFIIVLPPIVFANGFTVTVTDSDSHEHTIETDKKNQVLRSSLLVMPEITIGDDGIIPDSPVEEIKNTITIDGCFSDWDTLDPSNLFVANNTEGSKYSALQILKVNATESKINGYFELDEDFINGYTSDETGMFIWINADNSINSGDNLFIGASGIDYLFEIWRDNISNTWDNTIAKYTGPRNDWEWSWNIIAEEFGSILSIEGNKNKYEFSISKTDLESLYDIYIYETFRIGISVDTGFMHEGILPNDSVSDDNPEGSAQMLVVTSPTSIPYIDEFGINHGYGIKIDKTTWAPVNCGYHETCFKYGKLYQWGRKHGQGYSGGLYDFGGEYLSEVSDFEVPELVSGPVSLSVGSSDDNSDKFYINSENWLDFPDNNLWNSGTEENPVKTEYDPCPDGWRVPTQTELDKLIYNSSSWTANDIGQKGYWFSGSRVYSSSVPQIFFPAAGYRNNWGDASLRGYQCLYWSSYYQASLRNYYQEFGLYWSGSGDGQSIRCVQE